MDVLKINDDDDDDDDVVPSHQTDWDLRSFAVAGPSSWNVLPVGLRSSSFSSDMFVKHLKNTSSA